MSSRPFPPVKNYQEAADAQRLVARVLEEIELELRQMGWVLEGERHPTDIHRHRKKLKELAGKLKAAVRAEASVTLELHDS